MSTPSPRFSVHRAGVLAARTVGTSIALLAASAATAQAHEGGEAPEQAPEGWTNPAPEDVPGTETQPHHDETPGEDASSLEAPVEDTPEQDTPAEPRHAEEQAPQESPAEPVHEHHAPAEHTPEHHAPAEDSSAHDAPAEHGSAEEQEPHERPVEHDGEGEEAEDHPPAEDPSAEDAPSHDVSGEEGQPGENPPEEHHAVDVRSDDGGDDAPAEDQATDIPADDDSHDDGPTQDGTDDTGHDDHPVEIPAHAGTPSADEAGPRVRPRPDVKAEAEAPAPTPDQASTLRQDEPATQARTTPVEAGVADVPVSAEAAHNSQVDRPRHENGAVTAPHGADHVADVSTSPPSQPESVDAPPTPVVDHAADHARPADHVPDAGPAPVAETTPRTEGTPAAETDLSRQTAASDDRPRGQAASEWGPARRETRDGGASGAEPAVTAPEVARPESVTTPESVTSPESVTRLEGEGHQGHADKAAAPSPKDEGGHDDRDRAEHPRPVPETPEWWSALFTPAGREQEERDGRPRHDDRPTEATERGESPRHVEREDEGEDERDERLDKVRAALLPTTRATKSATEKKHETTTDREPAVEKDDAAPRKTDHDDSEEPARETRSRVDEREEDDAPVAIRVEIPWEKGRKPVRRASTSRPEPDRTPTRATEEAPARGHAEDGPEPERSEPPRPEPRSAAPASPPAPAPAPAEQAPSPAPSPSTHAPAPVSSPAPSPSTRVPSPAPIRRVEPLTRRESRQVPGLHRPVDETRLVPAPLPPRDYEPVPTSATPSAGPGHSSTPHPAPHQTPAARQWPSGMPASQGNLAAERGRPADVLVVDVDGRSWGTITSATELAPVRGSKARLVVKTPMLPRHGFTLEKCAAGAYRTQWASFGRRLEGLKNAPIVDLGASMNEGGHPWSGDPKAYAACYREVAGTIRKAAPQVLFQWTPALGSRPGMPGDSVLAAWPGSDVVDVVGVDAAADGRPWSEQVNGAYGLNQWASFADRHGKRIAVARWGVHAQAAKDRSITPAYVRNMRDWVARIAAKKALAYEAYSEPAGVPKEIAAAYRALF